VNLAATSGYLPVAGIIHWRYGKRKSLKNENFRVDSNGTGPTGNELERDLLRRISARDRDAFRELYLRYHRRLARFLTRLLHRYADAEEIINDTLWIVWHGAGEFRNASRVSTWIMDIAYRRALNMIRRATTHEHAMTLEIAESEGTVSDSARALEEHQLLRAALARLSLEQRLVLEFTYDMDYSCEEIAEIMECPVNTVKTRVFHARRKLRTNLADAAPGIESPL
jgi:RNA polymerase sigma-70 factor, ECF subfamily